MRKPRSAERGCFRRQLISLSLFFMVSLCLCDVTAHEKPRYLAYYDPLAGLLNRRVMESVLEREYCQYQRYPKSLSLVFVTLDHFKHNPLSVNEITIPITISYGFATAGDLNIDSPRSLLKHANQALYEAKKKHTSANPESPPNHPVDPNSGKIIDQSR